MRSIKDLAKVDIFVCLVSVCSSLRLLAYCNSAAGRITDWCTFLHWIHSSNDSSRSLWRDSESCRLKLMWNLSTISRRCKRPLSARCIDWDVATIIEASEKRYRLWAEHKHLISPSATDGRLSSKSYEPLSSNKEHDRELTPVKWSRGLVNTSIHGNKMWEQMTNWQMRSDPSHLVA